MNRSTNRGSFVALVLAAQILVGCASKSNHIPLAIPRDEFRRTAQALALAPVTLHGEIDVAESSMVRLDELIETTLIEAGYRCIRGSEYQDTWERILHQMGGIYDSVTGELDELKFDVARDQLRRDLADMYQTDYLIYPELWVVAASHSSGVANWDGTSQAVVGFGTRVLNVIDAILNQYDGFLEPGLVDALSLVVVVENMEGVEVFQSAGGIEVLKDKSSESDGELSAPLSDADRIRDAVRTALMPFLEGRDRGSPPAGADEVG